MNTEALFLFLILLLGLLLCSFLGGNCGKEGFNSSSSSNYNSNMNDSSSSSSGNNNGVSNFFSNFDNYNHYSGSSSSSQLQNGMVFTDPSGDTITVITNSNGTQSLQLTSIGQSTPMVLSSTPSTNSNITPQPNTFYAPYGGVTATITTDNNNYKYISVNI